MFPVFPTTLEEAAFAVVVFLIYMVAMFPMWMTLYEEISAKSKYTYRCHWPAPRCKGQCRKSECPRWQPSQVQGEP